MKEDKITKRIKELQKDTKFTFKLTEDIIASVYRIAVEDCALEKKDEVVSSGKEMNKRFGTKRATIDYDELQKYLFKAKQEAYRDILNHIEKNKDLIDIYQYAKEMAKKTMYDEVKII